MSRRDSNSTKSPRSRDPAVRHAGRAHIRGKIRRVWRPRYLELLDSGIVRYYELPATADVTLPEDSDWDHVNMIPKDTLVIFNARIIDVTTLRDLHVGLPGGSFGFLFRGQRQCTQDLMINPEPNPPREYFCAVSTLEEAQTWVVVLQWAATKLRRNPSLFGELRQNACSIEIINPQQQKQEDHVPQNSLKLDNSTSKSPTPPQPKIQKLGRIVVPKVQGYRIIKSSTSAMQWEIAYEIALLLVQLHKVEERHILKTCLDLETLFSQLEMELKDNTESPCVLDKIKQELNKLPRFHQGCQPHEITSSFSSVEKCLRTITRNATLVNTLALKRCFALDAAERITVQSQTSWWQTPRNSPTITYRKSQSIPTDTTDQFVRQWLTHKPSGYKQPEKVLWLLQKPWLVVGGAGVCLACSMPILSIYQSFMISFSIRADFLILSWFLAFYAGKEHNNARQTQQRRLPKMRSKTSRKQEATARATTLVNSQNRTPEEDGDSDESAADVEEFEDYVCDDNYARNDDSSKKLSSPLPQHPANCGDSCWSVPPNNTIFKVRGPTYLDDRVKIPSGDSPFTCRGVDLWLTDNPLRHVARHPSVMGGRLGDEDTFLVNFLLPFGNFVSYFKVPSLEDFPSPQLAKVWSKFIKGDQQYRDARLKLLPIVMDGPWIVKAAVGNGTAPALLGKVIPLQYYFQEPSEKKKGVYEVDVIITASSIAKGILSVVKGHTKSLTIAFAFIIEAAEQEELPESVLCSFQIHSLHLEKCPHLPECNLD